MRSISSGIRDQLVKVVTNYGAVEATARRLISSSFMPIMLNGQNELTHQHLVLLNQSAVNHIIRIERAKQFPFGTDFLGVQHEMPRQDPKNPYICEAIMYPDGKFIVCGLFPDQSRKIAVKAVEYHNDKTYKRTNCHEYEINAYSHEAHHIATIARIFTDAEDEIGYYRAIQVAMSVIELDIDTRIQFGHMVSRTTESHWVKAILVDMHLGQAKGIGRYLAEVYPEKSAAQHISFPIVKVCRVHWERAIHKLRRDVDDSNVTVLILN